jgi:tetratricopeptide (TPR) repeat protein
VSRRAASLLAAASFVLGAIAPVAAQPGATPTGPAPTPTAPIPGADDPATGPGLGLPPPSTRPVLGPAAAMTDAEKEALADLELEYEHYIAQADRHNVRMREHLLRAYTTRTAEIEAKYADKIAKATGDKLLLTEETRALLEGFIKAHPDEPQMTPDAMFRLATVYLDIAEQEVEIRAKDDPNALADYSRSLALWQAILDRFPGYRQIASTLYLLAYYGKTADERRSLQLFLSLTCANKFTFTGPPPALPTREEAIARSERKERRDPYADCQAIPGAEVELVRHAWVRGIADYQFAVPGELDDAIAAYLKVVDGGQDSSLFAEALYKLAWSYYKRDFLLDSITRFDESVKLYDSIVAGGGSPNLELREESIQYIAVAFTDPWDGAVDSNPTEAFTRVQNYYQGRESEPHVRDVWVAMGYAFIELQAYDQAIDAFRKALGAPWELDPKNPIVHQEIVNTWELKGDKLAADAAAAELAVRYAPGHAVVRGQREGSRGDGGPAPHRRARAVRRRPQHPRRGDQHAQGVRRRRQDRQAAARRLHRVLRQGHRAVHDVHRAVPGLRLRLRVQLLHGRGAVLQRALLRRRRPVQVGALAPRPVRAVLPRRRQERHRVVLRRGPAPGGVGLHHRAQGPDRR